MIQVQPRRGRPGIRRRRRSALRRRAAFWICAVLAVSTAVLPGTSALAVTLETVMASVDDAGVPFETGASQPAISADGRFVVFVSASSTLVDTSGRKQVFRRDLVTKTTRLVSGPGDGAVADDESTQPAISADGRFVAFTSRATNLGAANPTGAAQIYVRDMAPGGATRLASVGSATREGAAGDSAEPSVSADGTRIAFQSRATDLTTTTAGDWQVYVADMASQRPQITMVSVQDAVDLPGGAAADSQARSPSISADGRAVAFSSAASNLTTDLVVAGASQIYLHRTDGRTVLVSRAGGAAIGGGGSSDSPAVSGDGSRVAFTTSATNLGSTPTAAPFRQVYLRDLRDPVSILISVTEAGLPAGGGPSIDPTISRDGQRVAFSSYSPDLMTRRAANSGQVYLRDLAWSTTALLSGTLTDPEVGGADASEMAVVAADGTAVAFRSSADDLVATTSGDEQVYVRAVRTPRVERLSGGDRFDAAVAMSRAEFSADRPVAFIASGAVFPDALSGSAAAGRLGGPVLLVQKDTLPASVGAELIRLNPGKIVILGGPATVSPALEAALGSYAPVVERMAGADRYDGSAVVSRETFPPNVATAYVASGEVFPDALSGSAAAGRDGAPVLLVSRDSVGESVLVELERLKPGRIVVLGGASTVSDSVLKALGRIAASSRLAGPDRYSGSAAVSRVTYAAGSSTVFLASGAVFPDALAGSAAAIARRSPVLLIERDGIPEAVRAELDRLRPDRIVVLGGPNTVSDRVQGELADFLAH